MLSSEEARELLDALGSPVPLKCFGKKDESIEGALHRDRLMAQCGLYVGLRCQEVCDLELDKLNAIRIADDTHPYTHQKFWCMAKVTNGARSMCPLG